MIILTALACLFFLGCLCVFFSPRSQTLRRLERLYRLYGSSAKASLPEAERWQAAAEAYFRRKGWSDERAGQGGQDLRAAAEDFLARQDILKTEKQKACELARCILFYERAAEGRRRLEPGEVERIRGLVETAAQKFL